MSEAAPAGKKDTFFCTPGFGTFGTVIDLGVDLAPVRDRIQACKLRYHRELWEIICDRGIQGGGKGGGGGGGEGGGGEGGGGEAGEEGAGEEANQSNAPSPQPLRIQQQQRLRQQLHNRGPNNSSNAAAGGGMKVFSAGGVGGPAGFFGAPPSSPPLPLPPPGVRFQQQSVLPQPLLVPPLPQQAGQQPPPLLGAVVQLPMPPAPSGNQRLACLMRSKAKLPPVCCSIAAGYLSSTSPISSPSSLSTGSKTNNVSNCSESSVVIEHRKLAGAPSTITADDMSPTESGDFVPLRCGDWSLGAGSAQPSSKKRASRKRQKQVTSKGAQN